MLKGGILKNLKKYNNIKLAKGLNLQFFVTAPRGKRKYIGISTTSFGDKWFITPRGRAIFKTYDSEFGKEIRNIRIVNELVCMELCKQMGIGCAEYQPAHIQGQDGLLSYDIADGKKLVSFCDFISVSKRIEPNLFGAISAMDKYIEKGYKINKKEMVIFLYKTILFDTLTLQTDRNQRNFNFLYDAKAKEFKPAKLIDNEFAFCGELLSQWLTNDYGTEFGMHDILYEYNLTGKMLTFDGDYVANAGRVRKNIENLVLYAKKHKSLMSVLNESIRQIDVSGAFEAVENMGFVVNKDYKDYVGSLVFNLKKMILLEKDKKITREELADIERIF